MNIAFLRHGPTEWNALGRMQGRRDVPLSAAGRREIAAWRVPAAVARNARWLSSPLSRAVETALHLAGRRPALEAALIEMDWGAWEGYRNDELRDRFGDNFTRNAARGLDFRPPGGECPRDVVARISRWLESVAASTQPLVCVTHNGVLGALLALATGWDMSGKPPIRLRPATVHRFTLTPGPRLVVTECNVVLTTPDATVTEEPPCPPPPAPSAALP
jgi:probable phosphoglycerate mutase